LEKHETKNVYERIIIENTTINKKVEQKFINF